MWYFVSIFFWYKIFLHWKLILLNFLVDSVLDTLQKCFLFTLHLMFSLFTVILADNWNVSLSDTKLWDIMAEVVKLCMYPSPLNPFAVDFKYFEGLPLAQRVIATGAMAHFLQKVVASGDHAYNARGTLLFNHFHHSEHNALSLPLVASVEKKIPSLCCKSQEINAPCN